MKTILITGVSSGIGAASARIFLQRGYRVLGTVRRPADAQPLQSVGGEHFVPLVLDMADEQALGKLGSTLTGLLGPLGLDGLVNNAGIATAGSVIDQPYDELVRQFQINVLSPVLLLRAVYPFLKAAQGRVIQVGSVAGELTLPFFSAYAGSKHAMEAQSDALRRELLFVGISVVHLQFGSVQTPIWGKISEATDLAMANSDWKVPFERFKQLMQIQGKSGLPAETAAARLVEIYELKRPRTRYAILKNRFARWTLPRLLSDNAIDQSLGKGLGLLRK